MAIKHPASQVFERKTANPTTTMAQIRPLAPELAEVARTQLHEVEETIERDIKMLRCWIEQQPYLKARTDDQFLVAFLRFCQYNLENAKKRIDYYYTYKSTTAVEMFKLGSCPNSWVDDVVLRVCRAGIFATLAKPVGAGGPRIHFTRMGNIDTSVHTVIDIFRYHMLRSEIEINTDDNWVISGVLEILDFSKIPYSLVRQFEPSLFKKMAAFLEYGVPTNLRGTHIVNASKEVQLLLTVVRALMKQRELLHVHSNIDSLIEAIGKEYLPNEFAYDKTIAREYLPTDYGGNNGSLADAVATGEQQLMEYKSYFVEDLDYCVDEKLRKSFATLKVHSNTEASSHSRLEFD